MARSKHLWTGRVAGTLRGASMGTQNGIDRRRERQMRDILGHPSDVLQVAAKAVLLYVTAVVGFRLAARRTLAEMNAFDFVAAVAVGAIVGRVPNADGTGYLEGMATLVAVLACHAVLTQLRRLPGVSVLTDHTPRLLVVRGQVQERQLRRSGLTRNDLNGLLRQRGIHDLSQARYVIFESRGQVSVVPQTAAPDVAADLLDKLAEVEDDADQT
jgi:uncharacterized membrane protein YcaP (DUF421 family)